MVLATLMKKKARPACPRHKENGNTYSHGSSCGACRIGKLELRTLSGKDWWEKSLMSIFKEASKSTLVSLVKTSRKWQTADKITVE